MQFAENALRDRRGETEEDTFMNNATEKFKDMISGGGDCQSDNDCTPYLGHCVINPEPVRRHSHMTSAIIWDFWNPPLSVTHSRNLSVPLPHQCARHM